MDFLRQIRKPWGQRCKIWTVKVVHVISFLLATEALTNIFTKNANNMLKIMRINFAWCKNAYIVSKIRLILHSVSLKFKIITRPEACSIDKRTGFCQHKNVKKNMGSVKQYTAKTCTALVFHAQYLIRWWTFEQNNRGWNLFPAASIS